ncbi:DNA (cytosine-5)-methyltransferase 3A [Ooceraea biroi]|uniref:DNA (cytosine-5-)-methyltransferase n=3 Tax=Ooceraea biroi TaxID=2015173 RepID=A0A026VX92_OOCBI|nr:DNA (cytosine-5)-methyltransferase 3A [Ooceraea biroi]
MQLGLLPESSLKNITIVNTLDFDSMRNDRSAESFVDLETSDHETVLETRLSKFTNRLNATWPLIIPVSDPSSRPIRKRSRRKKRWTITRRRKPRNSVDEELNDATADSTIKRSASSPLRRKPKRGNLGVSTDAWERLSDDNFSSTQLHARSRDHDEDDDEDRELSKDYGLAGREKVRRATSTRNATREITQPDYSESEYSRSYTSSRQKEESRELSEYPEYFMNVLRIDNNTGEDDSDTSKDTKPDCDTSVDDARGRRSAKLSERAPRAINVRRNERTLAVDNRVLSKRRNRHSSMDKKPARNLQNRSIRRRRRRRRRANEWKKEDSATDSNYNSNSQDDSSACRSDGRKGDARGTARNGRKPCDLCNTRRHSGNLTNNACTCKRNLRNTASAIMRDIQEQIRDTEVTRDAENAGNAIPDISVDDPSQEHSKEKLDRDDVSVMRGDEEDNDNRRDNVEDLLFQESRPSSKNVEPKIQSPNFTVNSGKRRKKRLNRWMSSINCDLVDRTQTTYHSTFHECDLESSTTSSLKINMTENWKPEDGDNAGMIHSSFRSSLSEGCSDEHDSALLLARKIISDDLSKDEKTDDENKTMGSSCYKYEDKCDETLNSQQTEQGRSRDNFIYNSSSEDEDTKEDTEFENQYDNHLMKDIVTYRNKNKVTRRSSVDQNLVKDERDDTKVRTEKGMRKTEIRSRTHLVHRNASGKDNNLEDDSDKKEYVPQRITRALIKQKKDKGNHVGKLVWGYCSGWWPALIVDAAHVGMVPTSGKLWVYWIGESQISLLNEKTQIQPFSRNLEHRLAQPRKNIQSRAIDATIQILRQYFDCTLTKPYYFWIQRNISDMETLDDLTFYPYPKNIQERLDVLKEKNAKVTEKFISSQRSSPETTPPRQSAAKKQIADKLKNINTSWKQIEDERLPLQHQKPGVIAWAKIAGHSWWPAMIIDYRDCCLKEPSFGCQWIMWYGDYKVSEVRHLEFLKFHKGIDKMKDYIQNTSKQSFLEGVLQASKDYCSRLGCKTDNWTLTNVIEYFSNMNNIHVPYNQLQVSESNKIYDKYSDEIIKKINEFRSKPTVDDERKSDIKESDALRSVISGESTMEKLCLKCLKFSKSKMEQHPFFVGSLCKECSNEFKPCMFVFGNDGKCFYCTICASMGTVIICDREDCPRVYCTACLKYLICPKTYDDMLLEDPWECFLCRDESRQPANMLLQPRPDWKSKVTIMFRTCNSTSDNVDLKSYQKKKRPIRVLSLFDGLSTGLLVLLKLGLDVEVYYASEIDDDALMVSSAHFGDRITYLGDVRGITKEKIQEIAPIDLLIGGSPCNDLSLVNPARMGLHNPKGTGILFFDYCRIKKLLNKANKGRHLFWLFENVASMPTEYRLEINKHLGQEPDVIDSADFSPQHRLRLYWHNLPLNPYMPLFQKQQDVQDILTPHCNRYALVKKIRTVTTRTNSLRQGSRAELKPIMMRGECDTLWITELEEVFGFPRHYTDVRNLSATNRQKLIGRSWSVQTLTAILQPLCSYFKCNENETS